MNKIDVMLTGESISFVVNNRMVADSLDHALELTIDKNSNFNPLSANLIVLKSKSGIKLGRFTEEEVSSDNCGTCLFNGYTSKISKYCRCAGYSCNYRIDGIYLRSSNISKTKKNKLSLILVSKVRSSNNILLVNVND